MSELKDYSILDIESIDDERFKKEKAPGKWVPESRVYLKSEADKVIARHKYKRCLAMARVCRLRARWFGDNAFYKEEQWALRWHKLWLELAEKFKEEK